MVPLFILLLYLMSPLMLHALDCKLEKNVIAKTTWDNFKVKSANGAELTLLAVGQISADTHKEINGLILDESKDFAAMAPKAAQILADYPESLANHAALLIYLHDLVKAKALNYVIVDSPPENLPGLEKLTNRLYLAAFMLQVRESPQDVTLDRLILLDVGVPLYLKAVEPNYFDNVAVQGIPKTLGRVKSKKIVEEKPEPAKSSEDAFAKLERKLDGSRQSLREAHTVRSLIHSKAYAKLSNESIKVKVMSRFWNPAKPAVREWLNEELAGGDSKAPVPKKTAEAAEGNYAESLLARPAKGIAFLRPEEFARLRRDITELCGE